MKPKKTIIFIMCLTILILSGVLFLSNIKKSSSDSKESTLKLYYSSFAEKNLEIYNSSVVDDLKVTTEEDKNYMKLFLNDVKSFNLISIEENKQNPTQTLNGVLYPKENIAEFTINYDIDFDKNIYGSAGEGNFSVRKVLVRTDKNSPWLVAGQIDGQGY